MDSPSFTSLLNVPSSHLYSMSCTGPRNIILLEGGSKRTIGKDLISVGELVLSISVQSAITSHRMIVDRNIYCAVFCANCKRKLLLIYRVRGAMNF